MKKIYTFIITLLLIGGIVAAGAPSVFAAEVFPGIDIEYIEGSTPIDLVDEDGKLYFEYLGDKLLPFTDFEVMHMMYLTITDNASYRTIVFENDKNEIEYILELEVNTQYLITFYFNGITYDVKLAHVDSNEILFGPYTEYQYYIYFKGAGEPPMFVGASYYESYFSVPLSIDEILSQTSAVSEADGDISDSILIASTNYDDEAKQQLGEYYLTLEVTDSTNQTAHFEIMIQTFDDIAPIVNQKNYFLEIENDKVFDLDNFFTENVIYSDNYYSNEELIITFNYGLYTGNETIPGQYQISIFIEDPSGNSARVIVHLTVVEAEIIPPAPGDNDSDVTAAEIAVMVVSLVVAALLVGVAVSVFINKRGG